MEIKDKVIIVTGASQGIGQATAKHLAKLGAKVVMAARSADILKRLEKELPGSLAVTVDMRKDGDIVKLIKTAVDKFGKIDVLINNAGQGIYGPIAEVNINQYRQVMELNVFGVLTAMQEVIPIMRKQKGGMIINVSSMVAKMYLPGLAAYASTKYALNALSFTARQELAKENIIVSTISPRMTSTNFGKNSVGNRPDWGDREMPDSDTPEQVAEKIAELIETEREEISMGD